MCSSQHRLDCATVTKSSQVSLAWHHLNLFLSHTKSSVGPGNSPRKLSSCGDSRWRLMETSPSCSCSFLNLCLPQLMGKERKLGELCTSWASHCLSLWATHFSNPNGPVAKINHTAPPNCQGGRKSAILSHGHEWALEVSTKYGMGRLSDWVQKETISREKYIWE